MRRARRGAGADLVRRRQRSLIARDVLGRGAAAAADDRHAVALDELAQHVGERLGLLGEDRLAVGALERDAGVRDAVDGQRRELAEEADRVAHVLGAGRAVQADDVDLAAPRASRARWRCRCPAASCRRWAAARSRSGSGPSGPASLNASRAPKIAALTSRMSCAVSMMMRSTPPSTRPAACSVKTSTSSRKLIAPSVGSSEAGRWPVGPIEPATKRSSPTALRAICGGLHVDLARVLAEAPLVELEAAGLEGVGLDDLGAGLDHRRVHALDDVGAVEHERLVRPARKLVVVLEREVELLERGAHAAVEDDDALAGGCQVVAHRSGKRIATLTQPCQPRAYRSSVHRTPYKGSRRLAFRVPGAIRHRSTPLRSTTSRSSLCIAYRPASAGSAQACSSRLRRQSAPLPRPPASRRARSRPRPAASSRRTTTRPTRSRSTSPAPLRPTTPTRRTPSTSSASRRASSFTTLGNLTVQGDGSFSGDVSYPGDVTSNFRAATCTLSRGRPLVLRGRRLGQLHGADLQLRQRRHLPGRRQRAERRDDVRLGPLHEPAGRRCRLRVRRRLRHRLLVALPERDRRGIQRQLLQRAVGLQRLLLAVRRRPVRRVRGLGRGPQRVPAICRQEHQQQRRGHAGGVADPARRPEHGRDDRDRDRSARVLRERRRVDQRLAQPGLRSLDARAGHADADATPRTTTVARSR